MIMRLFCSAMLGALAVALAACGGDGAEPGTAYPAAGEDRFEQTTATVRVQINQDLVSTAGAAGQELQTVQLSGPALIVRSDPVQDGDVFVVTTEIREMELTGDSSLGPLVVRESSSRESKGEVRQKKAGQDFPAESFFDVFVDVTLPNLDGTVLVLHNEEPLRMESELSALPPAAGDEYRGEDERPLFTPAGIEVGRIVDALHVPEPDTEPGGQGTAPSGGTPPAATQSPAGPSTSGGCTHNVGQSVLHILFRGFTPLQQIDGSVVQTPPDGLIGDPEFLVTIDLNGEGRVDKDIAKFGTYAWSADDGLVGTYTVGQNCGGPPP
jgi:hypothetical protein